MSFKQRQINLQFSDEKGTVILEGLKCNSIISVPGGSLPFALIELRVYGMSLDMMNRYSSVGADMITLENKRLTVSAGDVGGTMTQVYSGTLVRSFIDFAQMPEVAFICSGVSGFFDNAVPAAPNSYPGAQNAEDMIKALASSIGYAFSNKGGAHAVLQDQYVYGSAISQIRSIAKAVSFPLAIENNTVTIWPNNGTRDDVVIDIGPDTGMVGYPTYWEAGFIVRSEFNPQIQRGRVINLTSGITKAQGKWPIIDVTHELSTVTPGGPWFTTTKLNTSHYVPTI